MTALAADVLTTMRERTGITIEHLSGGVFTAERWVVRHDDTSAFFLSDVAARGYADELLADLADGGLVGEAA